MTTLNPEQATKLVDVILDGPTVDRPTALFELLRAVADPMGDDDRYDLALSALRETFNRSACHENAFQKCLRGKGRHQLTNDSDGREKPYANN